MAFETLVQEAGTFPSAPTPREQLFEVLAFLGLIVPSMLISFFTIKQGMLHFVLVAVSTIARDLALVFLIMFFVWRNRERLANIGWTFKNCWQEAGVGFALFFPVFFATGALGTLLHRAGLSTPSTQLPSFLKAHGTAQFILAFCLVSVVAVAEETIFRGYLMLRIQGVTRSPMTAAVLSAFVFTLGHGYEGEAGLVTVGVLGFIFALVYLWRQSLVAPVVMHFLQDFVGVILVPLIGKH
jgi:membrane protease YdiL (CAAX protease family)